VAGPGDEWKGSGRSIPAFDLHAGLAACVPLLERFGGHRAAAGLSIRPERLQEFAAAFAREAEGVLDEGDLRPQIPVDAIVPRGTRLTLELCEELASLAPFGLGNPEITLLAAGCELADLARVGDGRHLRFRVRNGGHDAGGAIAFGQGGQLDRLRRAGSYDVVFTLEENRWNGTVAPQLQIRRVFDADERFGELRDWLAAVWRQGEQTWPPEARAIFEELELGEASGRRHLLESESFRALLAQPRLARAA
jgi:hypothetical protein